MQFLKIIYSPVFAETPEPNIVYTGKDNYVTRRIFSTWSQMLMGWSLASYYCND